MVLSTSLSGGLSEASPTAVSSVASVCFQYLPPPAGCLGNGTASLFKRQRVIALAPTRLQAAVLYEQCKMVTEISDAVWCLARFFKRNAQDVADMAAMNKRSTVKYVAYLPLLLAKQFHGF